MCSLSVLQDELERQTTKRALNIDAVQHCAGMLCVMRRRPGDLLLCC